jgi:hypothetical protein
MLPEIEVTAARIFFSVAYSAAWPLDARSKKSSKSTSGIFLPIVMGASFRRQTAVVLVVVKAKFCRAWWRLKEVTHGGMVLTLTSFLNNIEARLTER